MSINQFKNDKTMISKSQINGKFLKEYPMLKGVKIEDIKKNFDNFKDKKGCKTGNPLNKNQQKFVYYMKKDELARITFKDYFRLSRKGK